jgi:hypothetical protein
MESTSAIYSRVRFPSIDTRYRFPVLFFSSGILRPQNYHKGLKVTLIIRNYPQKSKVAMS